MINLYSIHEAAELAGIPYKRLWYAVRVGNLRSTRKVGRFRLFDDDNIAAIKQHFGVGEAERELDAQRPG